MADEGIYCSIPKTVQGTIGLHEEKIISENVISVRNADEEDLIREIEISDKCQLTVMGSTKSGPDESEKEKDEPKKEDGGVRKDINSEESSQVKMPEKISGFREEGAMGDDSFYLSDYDYLQKVLSGFCK